MQIFITGMLEGAENSLYSLVHFFVSTFSKLRVRSAPSFDLQFLIKYLHIWSVKERRSSLQVMCEYGLNFLRGNT